MKLGLMYAGQGSQNPGMGMDFYQESETFRKIFDLLPDEVVDGTSPLRLDLNFKKEIRKGARLSIGLKQERSDEFLFIARSGDQTLCSASVMRN